MRRNPRDGLAGLGTPRIHYCDSASNWLPWKGTPAWLWCLLADPAEQQQSAPHVTIQFGVCTCQCWNEGQEEMDKKLMLKLHCSLCLSLSFVARCNPLKKWEEAEAKGEGEAKIIIIYHSLISMELKKRLAGPANAAAEAEQMNCRKLTVLICNPFCLFSLLSSRP